MSPWDDPALIEQITEEITEYASLFKPVRSVSPVERNGQQLLAVTFEDGRSLATAAEFNTFHQTAMRTWPVTVSIDVDA